MPRFNKNRYITDDSYEVPWKSFKGSIEGTVRNYLQLIEDYGYAQWDDHATVTDITITGRERATIGIRATATGWEEYILPEPKEPRSKARTIVVEGITDDGEEIVFLKKIEKGGNSSSFLYTGGQRISPKQITQRLKLGKEEYDEMVERERADRAVWAEETIQGYAPRKHLDWS